MRGLLSALWSFLHHPAATFEGQLTALEARLAGDLKTAVDTGVAGVQARLETVKRRVVEDLKHELHRVVLILTLAMGCAVLALVGMIFGLMAAWTYLKSFVGTVGASLVLAIVFLLASLVVLGLLRSVLHRSQPPPIARNTAT
jgi:ribose/xylose/arabinose/galactoside ABC-type transport system permease subunit